MDILKVPKSLICLAWMVLGTSFCFMMWVAYDSFWPMRLIEFYDDPIPIAREFVPCKEGQMPEFQPGDIIPIHFRGYKYSHDNPTVITKMINDSKKELPEIHPSNKPGPINHVGMSRRVPIDAHSGEFYIEISYIYTRNIFRGQEIYKVRTEWFKVKAENQTDTILKKALEELEKRNKREIDEYRKRKNQFEKDRKRFEEDKRSW